VGEKGDLFMSPSSPASRIYLGYIRQAFDPKAVADWYRHFLADKKTGSESYGCPASTR